MRLIKQWNEWHWHIHRSKGLIFAICIGPIMIDGIRIRYRRAYE